jgi:tetratricopeptide (TPR) repeat protein
MVAMIFGLVLATYWPALGGGLVWDDAAHVTRPDLQSLAGLVRIWTDLHSTQQYYPVLHSAFWIEHRLWGDGTLGYHLVNVILHATSCCLLALFLQRLWRPDRGGAVSPPAASGLPAGAEWLAAAIFAVHPVCVESVAWISEQKNTLSLVFYLLAALAYLDFDLRRHRWSYERALAFFILALATKSVTATLPAALLVVLWWRNGRLSGRRDVAPLIPWFIVAAGAGLLTVWVERKLIGAEGAGFDLSFGQRLLLAGRVVWFYVGKVVWPADLMFVYPRWDVPALAAGWFLALAGVVATTLALWLVRGRSRGPLAAWLFFVGTLFPALGFLNVYPFRFSYVADHFQYHACLGVIVAAAVGLSLLADRTPPRVRAGAWVSCGLLVIGLALLARRQSGIYRDGGTLYRATLAKNPECWMAHNNLGVELTSSPGHLPEALAHYERALQLQPDYAEAHNNYGNALATLPGRAPEALAHFAEALRLQPNFAEAHVNLANALVEMPGRSPEAIAHYEQALRLSPGVAEIHYDLANALAKSPDRVSEALVHYAEALRLNPAYAEAHVNLANALAGIPGRMPEALAHYAQALRLNPSLAKTHYDLAFQLSKLPGREADAIAEYEEALRLKPDYAKTHNNLAIEYARQGRMEEAEKHWVRALELNPGYEDARRNLDLLHHLKKK